MKGRIRPNDGEMLEDQFSQGFLVGKSNVELVRFSDHKAAAISRESSTAAALVEPD